MCVVGVWSGLSSRDWTERRHAHWAVSLHSPPLLALSIRMQCQQLDMETVSIIAPLDLNLCFLKGTLGSRTEWQALQCPAPTLPEDPQSPPKIKTPHNEPRAAAWISHAVQAHFYLWLLQLVRWGRFALDAADIKHMPRNAYQKTL